MLYTNLLQEITEKFNSKSINQSDMEWVKTHLSKPCVISLLQNILQNSALLEKIAQRSYTHALGFDKIVLMDLSKDKAQGNNTPLFNKTQLRLHIWDPLKTGALPIVESLHEHSFDFVSCVLTGHLENQRFTFSDLNEKELQLLDHIQKLLPSLSQDEKLFLNNQIEIIEAMKLAHLGSNQLKELHMLSHMNWDRLISMTNLSQEQLWELTCLEGHYVSNRVAGEKKAYKHVLSRYVAIKPFDVLKISACEYYFHPYHLPHRLYYDNHILNSTILLTTPVAHNPEGGSLQRPTYVESQEQHYDKKSFSIESFKATITAYINYLEQN